VSPDPDATGNGWHDALTELLAALATVVDPGVAAKVADMRRRLRDHRFRVLVVGAAKRGKSTLINALLGREVLPADVIPVTAVATTVTFGAPERIVVAHLDGTDSTHALDELSTYVSELDNPDNKLAVDHVTVYLQAHALVDGLELVDTPGAGSVHDHDQEMDRALANMDAAIFVLTADPPISADERELLIKINNSAVHTFIVVNKADHLSPGDANHVLTFVTSVITTATGTEPVLYLCSARQALDARVHDHSAAPEPGIVSLEVAFSHYLQQGRVEGLRQSLLSQARGIALHTLDGVRIRLRLLSMEQGTSQSHLSQLRQLLTTLAQRRYDATDLVSSGTRHLLDEINDAAELAYQALPAHVADQTRRFANTVGVDLDGVELHTQGWNHLTQTAERAVDQWRNQLQDLVEQRLTSLERRLLSDLATHHHQLRVATRELLELDLSADDDHSGLIEDMTFRYQLTPGVSWNGQLLPSLRYHLPGAAARRRIVKELEDDARRLTAQQIGRVRADLQSRLRQSSDNLSRAISDRYTAATSALSTALEHSERSHGQTSTAAQHTRQRLAEQEQRLRHIVAELEEWNASRLPHPWTSVSRECPSCAGE